jgi:hypothetical protein
MSTVQLKRSAVASKVPATTDVALGELALNTYDGRLFFKKDSGTPAIVTVVTTDDSQTLTNKTLTSAVISGTLTANGSVGANNQVLTSNTTGVYWSTPTSTGVTSITAGNGLAGGTITTSGTVSVLANTGIVSNATGVYVNSAYIATISANNSTYFNGYTWAAPAALGGTTANTGQFTTLNVSASANALTFANTTSAWIQWPTNGVQAPTFTTSSVGTKLLLYPAVSASSADYAIGLESGALWFGVPTSAQPFKWYGGTTQVMSLSGAGALSVNGSISSTSLTLSTNTATIGTAAYHVANGNFGIGTSSPAAKLDVFTSASLIANLGSSSIDGGYLSYNTGGTNPWYLGSGQAIAVLFSGSGSRSDFAIMGGTTANLIFGTSNTERMRIDATGNVGIGNTTPGSKLTVGGDTYISGNSVVVGTVNAASYTVGTAFTANSTIVNAVALSLSTNVATIGTGSYFVANGNVGIGTSSPAVKLHVVNGSSGIAAFSTTSIIEGSGSVGLQISSGGTTNPAYIFLGVNGAVQATRIAAQVGYTQISASGASDYMTFQTGGFVDRVRIDASGNVGIGTAAPFTNTTSFNIGKDPVAIADGSYFGGGLYYDTGWKNTVASQGGWAIRNSSGVLTFYTGAANGAVGSTITATEVMRISSNGNVGIGTSSPSYKLQVAGSFAATTKSFVIDHPTKPDMKLRYGSLESPYHGVRLTGESETINGVCVVKLPNYIHGLCKHEGSQVQITNIKHGKVLWVDSIDIDNDEFTIATEEAGNYKFYWSFTAIRKDVEDMIVEF